jgi:DNA mismatch repair protein MutS
VVDRTARSTSSGGRDATDGRGRPCYTRGVTPIRRQYLDVKRRFPDTIVLFRLGDFYETFDADADLCARELNLTLTSRPLGKNERVPMAGIPHHALNGYLARLVARGHRVAICDQIGEPNGRALVERAVTRVVTPGTVLTDDLLSGPSHNFLAALAVREDRAGLAHLDISTGEFATTEIPVGAVTAELNRIAPAELVLPTDEQPPDGWSGPVSRCRRPRQAEQTICDHFGATTVEAFGLERHPLATAAAALAIEYLRDTQPRAVGLLDRLRRYEQAEHMTLDPQTQRNLELFAASRSGDQSVSLVSVIDRTCTPMGARLLRAHVARPLLDVATIEGRLDAVSHVAERPLLRDRVRGALKGMPDLERLVARTAAGVATPRDLVAIRRGLIACQALACILGADRGPLPSLGECGDAAALIEASISDDPPSTLDAGGVIRDGYNTELDEERRIARDARQVLADLERRERERTGIRSLRVAHNRVFGYYIEVTAANVHLVPDEYQRRQSVSSGERFITPELKDYEARIVGAQERVGALETALFLDVCAQVAAHGPSIRALAAAVATIDLAASHAEVAAVFDYCRPTVDESDVLDITDGRHPVLERLVAAGGFVPNDCRLGEEAQITILTGPNMAGKSTYLRQVALIVLLAQIGSFVPASRARIGLVDRIFTRVGAQDDLAAGNSTFMVEMVETAHILHHATPRSLIVLDEVGRGTSTYDGLAIARAIVEYLHNQRAVAARTLFATHYHELTELASALPRVRNACVAVIEQGSEIVFLHRIVAGSADRSYGIHVAQRAGLPRAVTQRAGEILVELERPPAVGDGRLRGRRGPDARQLSLFPPPSPVVEELAAMDIDALSPLEALGKLYELRERARGTG